MENKYFKAPHQGPSWSHFRGRDIHTKELVHSNLQNKTNIAEKKEKNTSFSWIMDTINPLNHVPIVSSIKNFITKSNKSLDVIQSAVGGFLFAGPLGIIKGLGGWAANKIANKFIANNIDKKKLDLESNLKKPNKIHKESKLSTNEQVAYKTNNNLISGDLQLTSAYVNNYEILKKKSQLNQVVKNYSEINSYKNKINISA